MLDALIRLELLNLRAFWRVALRDGVFVAAVVLGLAVAVAVLWNLYGAVTSGMPPAAALLASAGGGAVLFAALYPNASSRALTTLIDGPFFPLVSDRKSLARWLALRTGALQALIVLFAALVFAARSPAGAGLFLVAALTCGALSAVFWMRPPAASAPRAGTGGPGFRAAPSAIARILTVTVVLSLGGLAAALAAHNNDAPGVGVVIATIAAFAGALILGPGGAVTAFAGREPPNLPVLYLRLHATALTFALLGGILAALAAFLGVMSAVETGFNAVVLAALFFAFQFLHRLIRSQRNASLSLAGEGSAALMSASVQVSLGVIWLIVRAVFLVRAARRRRWLDR